MSNTTTGAAAHAGDYLRFRLGQSAQYNEIAATIALNIGKRVIGIVVDSVSDVVALTREQITPPPQLSSGMDAAYVTGLATEAQGDQPGC